MSKGIRAFFALEIKNPHVISNVAKLQEKLEDLVRPLRIKSVEPENLHLTMRFLGNIDEETAKDLYLAVESEINDVYFADGPLEYEVRRLGDFKKRVFFVDLEGDTEKLREMKQNLEDIVVERFDFKPDRKFRTHITIGRLKRYRGRRGTKQRFPYEAYKEMKEEYKAENFGSVIFHKIYLKKSTLTPRGPIYENLIYE